MRPIVNQSGEKKYEPPCRAGCSSFAMDNEIFLYTFGFSKFLKTKLSIVRLLFEVVFDDCVKTFTTGTLWFSVSLILCLLKTFVIYFHITILFI